MTREREKERVRKKVYEMRERERAGEKKEKRKHFLCKKCHKNIDENEPVVSHNPLVNFTKQVSLSSYPSFVCMCMCLSRHALPEVIDEIFFLFQFTRTNKEENEVCIE